MNPHPTKSKPCKIGRKHTGAPGIRKKDKLKRAKELQHSRRVGLFRKWKQKVGQFWANKLEVFPER